jgi:hypothetical protein
VFAIDIPALHIKQRTQFVYTQVCRTTYRRKDFNSLFVVSTNVRVEVRLTWDEHWHSVFVALVPEEDWLYSLVSLVSANIMP